MIPHTTPQHKNGAMPCLPKTVTFSMENPRKLSSFKLQIGIIYKELL